ncbi:unnamed protein product [Rotaria sp. Silwood1]|nr:unnamed protein product [Rotaria sp. Silwood1]CAF4837619.1 unnamed protein product [Rotaria sp. Silwood1]
MSYNDKKDTYSEYESEAFQKAKFANGIPASKQPVNNGQPEKIPDRNNPGKFCYHFTSKLCLIISKIWHPQELIILVSTEVEE